MPDDTEDPTPAPKSKDGETGMQIYCGAPNPDYPGRSCTKMLNPDGSHVNPGDHSDGTYSW